MVGPAYQVLLAQLKALRLKREGLALGLWGEAGIGKSHTVRELLREVPCRSLSFHATTPMSELARALPAPPKLPAWAEGLLRRLERGEHLENEKTATALSAVLGGLAPVILHLEDLHEASPERLELVGKLAAMIRRSKGAALLVTSREAPPEPFAAFRLEPLDTESVRRLLEGETGAPLPPEALEWIYTRAAGNPLFTLEFFRHLARRGFLWNDGKKWRWRSPPQHPCTAHRGGAHRAAHRGCRGGPRDRVGHLGQGHPAPRCRGRLVGRGGRAQPGRARGGQAGT